MPKFRSRSGEIYFEQHGARAKPPVLLIHGMGCQVIQWPQTLIDGLVEANLRVIAFDHRDVGLSAGPDTPAPSLDDVMAATDEPNAIEPAYRLADLAEDAVDLLDHLGQAAAHVVGYSMGGMVAQHLAVAHPERVLSLTCVGTSAAAPQDWQPYVDAVAAAAEGNGAIDRVVDILKGLGGAHFDSAELGQARFAQPAFDRAHRPEGLVRQLSAMVVDGDRRALLEHVRIPALVIQGAEDTLFPPQAAKAIATAIPGAALEIIEKLGHDLPEPVIPQIVDLIASHTSAAGGR